MLHVRRFFMPSRRACPGTAALAALILGCTAPSAEAPENGARIRTDYTESAAFFDAPFPSDARLLPDGTADLSAFPNPASNALATTIIDIASSTRGFGTTTPVWFTLDREIDASRLPSVHDSIAPESPVFIVNIAESSANFLRRTPIETRWLVDGGSYGAPNVLALLPVQGIPLRPQERYAAVVRKSLTTPSLAASTAMEQLLQGSAPSGMSADAFAKHRDALEHLAAAGIPKDDIAAFTVFTTGAPISDYEAAFSAATSDIATPSPATPFVRNEVFADYCVYETTILMPVFQQGTPPYTSKGGAWKFDDAGKPILQRHEEANFVVTIPRTPMPTSGYPLVVLSRTGAGGERPLVDRGVRAEPGGPAVEPGAGPALVFAKAGFAGASVDGPHGGKRNVTKGDEQFLVFNIGNPLALRDNIRQSALELGLLPAILQQISIDVTDCMGATTTDGKAKFDTSTLAIMGHSMGASIVPLTAAFAPYRAILLSGAGGSFLANVVHKQKPLATKPLAEVLMGIAGSGYSLSEVDPLLGLLQWAGESADVPPYARLIREASSSQPRHVLMMQGIVDHYILPPIANPMSLSMGLDLAGDALDATNAELKAYTPLGDLLDLVARKQISLPSAGNLGSTTAVVVQHGEDGIEDGHEVVFQTEPPKHQMRCFLESLAKGTPRVPPPGAFLAACE